MGVAAARGGYGRFFERGNSASRPRAKVVSVIVTYNPNMGRFERVLSAAAEQTDYVVVVDNGSGSRQFIERLCGNLGNCDFVEMGYNSGVARALKVVWGAP